MSSPADHPIYPTVLRMVLWGEKREDVFHALKVNGVTGPEAEDFYGKLLGERVASIRAVYWAKTKVGLLWLTISGGLLGIGVFAMPGIRVMPYACVAGVAVGLWKAIDGFSGVLLASNKQGPVSDEI